MSGVSGGGMQIGRLGTTCGRGQVPLTGLSVNIESSDSGEEAGLMSSIIGEVEWLG